MKRLILFLLTLSAFTASSSYGESPLKLMNFNTMCDWCGDKEKYGDFKGRVEAMADTINRHSPDLLSLQEIRTKRQLTRLLEKLNSEYHAVYAKGIINYTDAVLLARKDRFEVLETDGFWLGPDKRMPFGHKLAFPRRIQFAKLLDKDTQREFIFAGSHFDNKSANKEPSAVTVNRYLHTREYPIIFAADTNLRAHEAGYNELMNKLLVDTFPQDENVTFYTNTPVEKDDACNKTKAITFPKCRIDHVLLSKSSPWKVKSWGVDLYKYEGTIGFVSDHRAVIVELEETLDSEVDANSKEDQD